MKQMMLNLLVLCLTVTCLIAEEFCHSRSSCDREKCHDNLDVAIVGAGPAGAYSAYMLRHSNKAIGIYEYSNRIGGRLFTYRMSNTPDVNLEIGGMRFIEAAHDRLEQVIEELGLNAVKFTEGFGHRGKTRLYLRGQSLTYEDVQNGTVPYNMNVEEKANQHRIMEYYLEKLTGYKLNGGSISRVDMLKLRVQDGRLLYQLTFDEAFDLVATPEGKEFVRDCNVFTTEVTDDASAISVFDFHHGKDGEGGQVFTVKEGMDAVPRGLINAFLSSSLTPNKTHSRRPPSKFHFIKYNKNLKAIRSRTDNSYVLYFQPTITELDKTTIHHWEPKRVVCARQVILAVPAYALKTVDWDPLHSERAEQAYDAIRPIPASKVFMTFKEPWWLDNSSVKNMASVTKSDELFSQMYDWKKSEKTGDYIMIASYADNNKTLFEKHLRDIGKYAKGSEPGNHKVSPALQRAVLQHLTKAYGVKLRKIPQPVTSMSQFWTDYPFGCGWITWKSGYHIFDTMDTMRRPSLRDDIFIAGADFSWGLMSSWVEGALETAEEIINRYFLE